jgi:Mor family transcriptional regulator
MDIIEDLEQRLKAIGFKDPKIEKLFFEVRREWAGERTYISCQYELKKQVSARNRAIIRDYKNGERVALLARRYGLSRAMIYQIING